tara:strand:+ start:91 stop:306 length:216 start_codon:yes stop_codon:yes gene_type:complete
VEKVDCVEKKAIGGGGQDAVHIDTSLVGREIVLFGQRAFVTKMSSRTGNTNEYGVSITARLLDPFKNRGAK